MTDSGAFRDLTVYVRRNVTDRALRYRATAAPPDGPKICAYCGSRRNVGVDHVNGREDDTAPRNLVWACKSCNTKKGALFARLGIGRKTRQFNPTWTGRPITAAERQAAYDLEDAEREAAAKHAEWVRRQAEAALKRSARRGNARPRSHGAASLGQWLLAVLSAKGESDAMTVPAAVEMIRATPDYRRTQFAQQIWSRRRERGTDTQVPF